MIVRIDINWSVRYGIFLSSEVYYTSDNDIDPVHGQWKENLRPEYVIFFIPHEGNYNRGIMVPIPGFYLYQIKLSHELVAGVW